MSELRIRFRAMRDASPAPSHHPDLFLIDIDAMDEERRRLEHPQTLEISDRPSTAPVNIDPSLSQRFAESPASVTDEARFIRGFRGMNRYFQSVIERKSRRQPVEPVRDGIGSMRRDADANSSQGIAARFRQAL